MISTTELMLMRTIRAMIEDRQKDIADGLCSGRAAIDFASYRYMVGQHKALTDVLAWANDVHAKMMGEDKKSA